MIRENMHVVSYQGFVYRALEEDWNPTVDRERCQKLFWSLPAGFEVAPDDSDTRRVLQTSFVCAASMILADGKGYYTARGANGRAGHVSWHRHNYLRKRQNAGVLELSPEFRENDLPATASVVSCVSEALCSVLCFSLADISAVFAFSKETHSLFWPTRRTCFITSFIREF